ncbi:MAG: hypothetical protein H6Q22_919 [Bacteroidetes bacterium]|nr:hypothetical protein [Bacteroidota bacterium]
MKGKCSFLVYSLCMMSMFFLLSTVSGISQPQNKKDSIEIARKAKFEIAKELLKSKTFGIMLDDNRTKYERRNFMGFVNNKLVLQGIFSQNAVRNACEVKNYIYKSDDNGNITVTFDFSGKAVIGSFVINMQMGDNYVEIIEIIRNEKSIIGPITNPENSPRTLKLFGEVLPSDSCNYTIIETEI